MPTLQELREARETTKAELAKLQTSVKERRSAGKTGAELWSDDEQKQFETHRTELTRLNSEIEGEERAVELEQFLTDANEQRNKQRSSSGTPNPKLSDQIPGGYGTEFGELFNDRDNARKAQIDEERRAFAFHAWACQGRYGDVLTEKHQKAVNELRVDPHQSRFVMNGLGNFEFRNLKGILGDQPTNDSRQKAFEYLERRAVGYSANAAFIPKTLLNSFELMFAGQGGILSLVDLMITDTADSITHPGGNDLAEGRQYNEGDADISEGTDPEMLSPTLGAFLFDSYFVKIHKQLLQNSPFDLAEIIGRLLAERLARVIERKLIEATRPTSFGGLVSRAAIGKQMASKSALAYAEFKALKYSVISNYRNAGTFVFHDETLAALAMLVDTTGRDLLDLEGGRFLNRPFAISNFMKTPAEVAAGTTGLTLSLFGDFKMMKARVVRQTTIERFNEKYAEKHQAAFLATRQADADLMRATTDVNCPIKRLKAPNG